MTVLSVVAILALTVPNGNAVTPPELTTHTPILNIIKPVQVGLCPSFGVEFYHPRCDGTFRFFDFRIMDKPLFAQARLDGDIGAFRITDGVFVGLNFN